MYDAVRDPYCYPGTAVLRNLANIRTQAELDEFESAMTTQRADEPLPRGRLGVSHYRAIHRHLFQDVYAWAGRYRSVRIAKDGSAFCYPENIEREMKQLFGALKKKRYLKNLPRHGFAGEAASFLSVLNAIHPFREGNGRTQMAFLILLADRAGYPCNLDELESKGFLAATIESFKGDERPLLRQVLRLTKPRSPAR